MRGNATDSDDFNSNVFQFLSLSRSHFVDNFLIIVDGNVFSDDENEKFPPSMMGNDKNNEYKKQKRVSKNGFEARKLNRIKRQRSSLAFR
jgi:hypothetical protein